VGGTSERDQQATSLKLQRLVSPPILEIAAATAEDSSATILGGVAASVSATLATSALGRLAAELAAPHTSQA